MSRHASHINCLTPPPLFNPFWAHVAVVSQYSSCFTLAALRCANIFCSGPRYNKLSSTCYNNDVNASKAVVSIRKGLQQKQQQEDREYSLRRAPLPQSNKARDVVRVI